MIAPDRQRQSLSTLASTVDTTEHERWPASNRVRIQAEE
jgi:hypothetical protein